MVTDSRVMSVLTTVLLLGTLSSGLPIPQNSPIEISPTVDTTQVQQPNGLPIPQNSPIEISPTVDTTQVQQPNVFLMNEALQQPQSDETNTGMVSDSQMMAAPQQAQPLEGAQPTIESPVVEATPMSVPTSLVAPPQVEASVASPSDPQLEVQEPEMQQPEMQQPEMQQPEMQQPQVQQPEVQQPEVQQTEAQQPAAAEQSRPDCPDMEAKHFIICEGDDKKEDNFQLIPETKDTQPAPASPQIPESTQ